MENPTIIKTAYEGFNDKDIPKVLSFMHEEIEWPNGMEGGYVLGKDAVRQYWERQWTQVDPHVEPMDIFIEGPDALVVLVRQTVRDLAGNTLLDQTVTHRYTFDAGLIKRMVIGSKP